MRRDELPPLAEENIKKPLQNLEGYAIINPGHASKARFGSVVKRLRHRPFTAVTRVRFPSESFDMPMWLNWQSS